MSDFSVTTLPVLRISSVNLPGDIFDTWSTLSSWSYKSVWRTDMWLHVLDLSKDRKRGEMDNRVFTGTTTTRGTFKPLWFVTIITKMVLVRTQNGNTLLKVSKGVWRSLPISKLLFVFFPEPREWKKLESKSLDGTWKSVVIDFR